MDPLKVGVVGVGHLGKEHARIFSTMPDVKLVCVADINPGRAKGIADLHRCKGYFNHGLMLDQVEAVSIAVNTGAHFSVARDFIDRGIPVMVEKPMTKTLAEADDLLELAQAKGVTVQIGHVERFNPAVEAVLPYINDPRFINADRLSPFSFRSLDVDVVLDLMIHDIDILLHLVPADVASIEAIGVPVVSDKIDIANTRIRFANGCIADVSASRVSEKVTRKIRVFSRDTYITLDYRERNARIFRKADLIKAGPLDPSKLDPAILRNPGDFFLKNLLSINDIPVDDEFEPLRKELASFVDCIRNKRAPLVTGAHGRKAMFTAAKITEEIHRNLEKKNGA